MIHWCLAHPWTGLVAMWVLGMWITWYERRKYGLHPTGKPRQIGVYIIK